ncbi:MAG TPA: WG repeat-containing protein [Anaeromyxobacteraceae bacterium]|nr:WG repeat-containing protein [Anaeromyxobacteraceae bacterium]
MLASLVIAAVVAAGAPEAGSASAPGPLFPVLREGKWGFIDRAGRVVIAPRFTRADRFSERLAAVQDGAVLGYVDETGRLALVPKERPAGLLHRPFSSGRAAVRVGSRWGFIDRTGALAIPARFTSADDFSDGYAMACDEDGCGYVDPAGRGAVVYGVLGSGPVKGGMACVSLAMGMGRQRVGLRKVDGTAIPGEWEGCGNLSEGLIAVRLDGLWGFVDASGRAVIPLRYDHAGDFSGGLAPVTVEGGRCGYVDRAGTMAIPARFRACHVFSGGLARVDLAADVFDGERVAFIDRAGRTVIVGAEASPPFDSAADFADGLAAVGAGGPPHLAGDGAWLGYVDGSGRYVWKPSQ